MIVLGWAWPAQGWLIFYLIFLPAMVLHWKLNRGACILNNLENWLRHRRWRAPETNPEEGAWLRTLIWPTPPASRSDPGPDGRASFTGRSACSGWWRWPVFFTFEVWQFRGLEGMIFRPYFQHVPGAFMHRNKPQRF